MRLSNPNFKKLPAAYLFPEVKRRVEAYQETHPDVSLVSLSIGNTSEPLPTPVIDALHTKVKELGTAAGYTGYGPEQGELDLRQKIAETYYSNQIAPDEIFLSDGAKCDVGRLQLLFDRECVVAIQDPTYPVYVDTSILTGKTALHHLPCTSENGFFPTPSELPPCDLLFLCSPNNPTGSAATHTQLTELVGWAEENGTLILFDAAYSAFIQDPTFPRSIYEIPGAEKVAIEIHSFSKSIGFTGVRLGWSVVPRALWGGACHTHYTRLATTFFNGPSNIAQAGGRAALTQEGQKATATLVSHYMENASLLRSALENQCLTVYGGENAPYLWVAFEGRNAWELFQTVLEETGIITTPGSGFGSCGEGFLRFSAFARRETLLEGVDRIQKRWPANLRSPLPLPI